MADNYERDPSLSACEGCIHNSEPDGFCNTCKHRYKKFTPWYPRPVWPKYTCGRVVKVCFPPGDDEWI